LNKLFYLLLHIQLTQKCRNSKIYITNHRRQRQIATLSDNRSKRNNNN